MLLTLRQRISTHAILAAQETLVYFGVIAGLLGILKLGHSTHWTFGLSFNTAHAAVATVATAPPVATKNPEDILLSDASAKKAGIELTAVSAKPVADVVVAHGTVDYDQDHVAQLSPRVAGTVWRIEKQVGSPVRKGEVLAIIEAIPIGEAKSDFQQAHVAMELSLKTLERMKQAGGALSERSLREAESEMREARVRLLTAHQKLVNLGLPFSIRDIAGLSDEALAQRIQFLGLPETITQLLTPETTTANLVPMLAPFDGIVISRSIALGEVVSPDQPHFVVADVNSMWLMLDVSKEDAQRIRLGQRVEFHADGSSAVAVGKIDWISTELGAETRTLQARAKVVNPLCDENETSQRSLKAHTFGSVRITIRETPDVQVVPSAAVQVDGTRRLVFVRHDAVFECREVKVGVTQGEVTEILTGLKSGEVVASAGSHVLKAQLQQQTSR